MAEETSAFADEQAASKEKDEGTEKTVMEEAEEEPKRDLPVDMYYNYEELHSKPFVTPDSKISENLLYLCHSFGYDCGRRANLQPLDEKTLIFIAGNVLILLDVNSKKQRYLRSCSGGGIGAIAVNPSKDYFAVAEKGKRPNILLYEYPSLRVYRILKDGTDRAYSCLDFNHDGSLLASVGNAPDFMLTLWIWKNEQVLLKCKAISQDVYRVSFSMHHTDSVTSAGYQHIKFWKIADTFTGLKLKGHIGHFGKITATDIEGFVELPDGKVLSGSTWGNLLLWEGSNIKAEICRKNGQTCHAGVVQPFALEDGQLMTMGSDGVIRIWDLDSINFADVTSDNSKSEMEPLNEMQLGHNVSLASVVKSPQPNSFVWFAQDSKGAIWKLDLSFTYTTPDPECLFSFHSGPIMGLDVSWQSHLMVTTALDHSVKVFDFLAKTEVTSIRFNQGGTTVLWAPSSVDHNGGLLVTGFEDGVIRLLELYNPQKLYRDSGFSPTENAKLQLKQAFKAHNAPVTAVAYEPNGKILATGSLDKTVFFFTVGKHYNPIGFIHVPGPVRGLEWSSFPNEKSLLILCQSGHVVEVHSPDPKALMPSKTFHLPGLPRRFFRFRSIKSRIEREIEMTRCQTAKEKMSERDDQMKDLRQQETEHEEEKQKESPPIYIPDPPSPLCCGFYSEPGQFWLSMGGFDSGYLYHCKFSKMQDEDPDKRKDEPFDFLRVDNSDNDPICSISFSTNRQMMLCGMHSGFIRVYPLHHGEQSLKSMHAYWTLSVHDNQYGHLQHIRSSYDDQFVLTAGDDGNIFSFSLLPPEGLQRGLQKEMAKIPLPRMLLGNEVVPQDIDDPAAYSIETAKQKVEKDSLHQKAELKFLKKQKKIAELQKKFKQLLNLNQSLPEHVHLTHEELHQKQLFSQQAERLKAQRLEEFTEQMSWEVEHCCVALKKLQDRFRDSLSPVVTVGAICTNHRIFTFRMPELVDPSLQLRGSCSAGQADEDEDADDAAAQYEKTKMEVVKDGIELEEEMVLHSRVARAAGIKLADRQVERLQKAAEKAEQAQAKIEKRRKEWSQLYAEKPVEDCEDAQDVEAICRAMETIGDLKLKSSTDYNVPKHLRMNPEGKREQLKVLEEMIHEEQFEINRRIIALRDSKIRLVSQLRVQAQQIQELQLHLPAHLHRPLPPLPTILPAEIPEKRLQPSRAILEQYQFLTQQRCRSQLTEEQNAPCLLEQLEKELEGESEEEEQKEEQKGEEGSPTLSTLHETIGEGETVGEEARSSEQEEEFLKMMQMKLQYEQDSLLQQMESSISQFDRELLLLYREKLHLYPQLKLADLHQLTLYQELLLLKEFEGREEKLQEKLNVCIKEENNITSKLNAYLKELEMKQVEVTKVQDREKALTEAFQETVADNPFEEFLTKVFKKMVKRKKKEVYGNGEEEDSDEDSDEDFDDWDDDFDSGKEGEAPLSDSVCPQGCDPELFENTLHLRELRLDLEELLAEKKKGVEALKKMCDTVVRKEKVVKHNRKAAEESLDLVNREKQQKINELDVVVPLRLNQITFGTHGPLTSDLGQALMLNTTELKRLQRRTKELQEEIKEQKDLHRQVRQQHIKLIKDQRDMNTQIHALEKKCYEEMMMKFGRLVDLESLQTLSGNRKLEELRQRKILQETAHEKKIKEWDIKVREENQALLEVIQCNTELLQASSRLMEEKRELDKKIRTWQKEMVKPRQDTEKLDETEIQRLQEHVGTLSQEIESLKGEIILLSAPITSEPTGNPP